MNPNIANHDRVSLSAHFWPLTWWSFEDAALPDEWLSSYVHTPSKQAMGALCVHDTRKGDKSIHTACLAPKAIINAVDKIPGVVCVCVLLGRARFADLSSHPNVGGTYPSSKSSWISAPVAGDVTFSQYCRRRNLRPSFSLFFICVCCWLVRICKQLSHSIARRAS